MTLRSPEEVLSTTLRVAVVTGDYPPNAKGGLGRHVGDLVSGLRNEGHLVDVYVVEGDCSSRPRREGISLPPPPEEQACYLDGAALGAYQRLIDAAKYDIVHCHDWHSAVVMAALAQEDVRQVYTSHLPAASQFRYGFESEGQGHSCSRWEHLAVRLADRVIAISDFVKTDLVRRYRIDANKISVVHNGVDTSDFSPSSMEKGVSVLFVGRLVIQKGADQLPAILEALSARSELMPIRVVGEGPLRDWLCRTLRESSCPHVVELAGAVPADQVREHYSAAQVLLMPSVYEPFGLVAIEAMACGLPVVAYSVGGLAEIVVSGRTGFLVSPGNVAMAAAYLDCLLSNQTVRKRMEGEARNRVVSRFASSRWIRSTISLYGRMLLR